MFSTITSGTICGISSCMVQVEVDISQGLPCFQIVGLPGSEVREARERVKVALRNAGISMPPLCVNVNLSPADIHKSGTMFDLPVAIGIMTALSKLPQGAAEGTLLIGELGLSGEIKPVRGVLPIVREAARLGVKRCILPAENAWEGALVEGTDSVGVSSLQETIEALSSPEGLAGVRARRADREEKQCAGQDGGRLREEAGRPDSGRAAAAQRSGKRDAAEESRDREDFADISGQESLKRAAKVAAAGFHNLLIVGAPGSGKTMLARRIPTILPPLTAEEALEVASVYSISGLLKPKARGADDCLAIDRPFLHPHHTVTGQALAGGGRIPVPGIVSLAHRGVLFLDELPEFKRETLDILRQPLEDRRIQIARNGGTYEYPADFMLVGAMYPCPCGYYPDMGRCRCTPHEIRRYLRRVSGPILDRMDVCVEAQPVPFRDIVRRGEGESSTQMREQVMRARERQAERFAGTGIRFNADMKAADVDRYCPLGDRERKFMEKMFGSMQLSARGYHRVVKVARTIADLEGSDRIGEEHLAEALCYRNTEVFR